MASVVKSYDKKILLPIYKLQYYIIIIYFTYLVIILRNKKISAYNNLTIL